MRRWQRKDKKCASPDEAAVVESASLLLQIDGHPVMDARHLAVYQKMMIAPTPTQ
jgi:hypothetical protein